MRISTEKVGASMRYFLDVLSDNHEIDEEGSKLQSDAQMQEEATRPFAAIASDEFSNGRVPALTTRAPISRLPSESFSKSWPVGA